MNKKVLLSWLILIALIATSASNSAAASGLSEQSGQFAAEAQRGVLADSDDSDDSDDRDDDDRDDDDRDDDPDGPPTPEPPLDSAPETPLVPTESKPTILDQSNWSPPQPLQPIIAFTFPSGISNWTIPVRAAAFVDITPDPSEQFTPVGMVEIGANPETESESQIYVVNIDLSSRETRVRGQLVPVSPPDSSPDISAAAAEDTVDVIFQRIPQRLNPARTNSPYEEFQGLPSPPDGFATIFADGVCFDVRTGNGTGNGGGDGSDDDSDNGDNDDANSSTNGGPIYNTYCSRPSGPDGSDAPLSVMDNFPSQYAELQSSISGVAAGFDLENRVQMNEIISTLESIQGIQDCASALTEEACGSDIIGVPVTEHYFAQQLNKAFGGNGDGSGGDGEDRDHNNGGENGDHKSQTVSTYTAMSASDDDDDAKNNDNKDNDDRDNDNGTKKPNGSPTPIAAAVVKVLKPIELPNGVVQPGDYVMHWWFDSNAVFYAVTLTGVTTDNTQVTNQQIPGVPATFIDKRREGPHQPASQISAWRVRINWFGKEVRGCVFGETC
jgi:hypothetical protein